MTDAGVRVVATRPTPGTPRPYDFPEVDRTRLSNGLSLVAFRSEALPHRAMAGGQRQWKSSSITDHLAASGRFRKVQPS